MSTELIRTEGKADVSSVSPSSELMGQHSIGQFCNLFYGGNLTFIDLFDSKFSCFASPPTRQRSFFRNQTVHKIFPNRFFEEVFFFPLAGLIFFTVVYFSKKIDFSSPELQYPRGVILWRLRFF